MTVNTLKITAIVLLVPLIIISIKHFIDDEEDFEIPTCMLVIAIFLFLAIDVFEFDQRWVWSICNMLELFLIFAHFFNEGVF